MQVIRASSKERIKKSESRGKNFVLSNTVSIKAFDVGIRSVGHICDSFRAKRWGGLFTTRAMPPKVLFGPS